MNFNDPNEERECYDEAYELAREIFNKNKPFIDKILNEQRELYVNLTKKIYNEFKNKISVQIIISMLCSYMMTESIYYVIVDKEIELDKFDNYIMKSFIEIHNYEIIGLLKMEYYKLRNKKII